MIALIVVAASLFSAAVALFVWQIVVPVIRTDRQHRRRAKHFDVDRWPLPYIEENEWRESDGKNPVD